MYGKNQDMKTDIARVVRSLSTEQVGRIESPPTSQPISRIRWAEVAQIWIQSNNQIGRDVIKRKHFHGQANETETSNR